MNVLYLNTERKERCTVDMVGKAVNYLLDLYSEHYDLPKKTQIIWLFQEKLRNLRYIKYEA